MPFTLMPSAQIFPGNVSLALLKFDPVGAFVLWQDPERNPLVAPLFLRLTFIFTLYICKSMPCVCRYLWKPQEGVGSNELELQTVTKHLTWDLGSQLMSS